MKERNIGTFNIIQYIVMAALLAFIVIMLVSGRSADVKIEDISASMNTAKGVSELKEKNMTDAAQNFSFDMSLVEEGIYRRVDDVMDVNELLILKISDDNNRQTVLDAIDRYLEEKTESFNGYGTDQFGLLSNAILNERGDYIFFGVSDDNIEWEEAFLGSLK